MSLEEFRTKYKGNQKARYNRAIRDEFETGAALLELRRYVSYLKNVKPSRGDLAENRKMLHSILGQTPNAKRFQDIREYLRYCLDDQPMGGGMQERQKMLATLENMLGFLHDDMVDFIDQKYEMREYTADTQKGKNTNMGTYKPIILFDFDGVIHSYSSGWQGEDIIPDPPVSGAIDFISEMVQKDCYEICIYSSRSKSDAGLAAMKTWLSEYLPAEIISKIQFPTEKPAAFITIDDRAICFDGDFSTLQEKIDNFKPWYRRK